MFALVDIQRAIARVKISGWLFYDFQGSDPIAHRILAVPANAYHTRRWFYYVPAQGEPIKLVHRIEPAALEHLPGKTTFYSGWKEFETRLPEVLKKAKSVAMSYSAQNAIPYVSRVDAGTIELVRGCGVKVVSAADLIQEFEAVLSKAQFQTHQRACKVLRTIVDETFEYAAKGVRDGAPVLEYDVQQFIWDRFAHNDLISDTRPITAVGPHAGNPHYIPPPTGSTPLSEGQVLLIDIWAKEKAADAVYADITWTAFLGKTTPKKCEEVFQVVRGGRDAALELVRTRLAKGQTLKGAEVDDAAREYITKKGYGEYFIHRTGHNIGLNVHGNGANMDNFETREERTVLPHTCFSIEPGVYLEEFGIRSEIDVFVTDKEAHVYSEPIQTTLAPLL